MFYNTDASIKNATKRLRYKCGIASLKRVYHAHGDWLLDTNRRVFAVFAVFAVVKLVH